MGAWENLWRFFLLLVWQIIVQKQNTCTKKHALLPSPVPVREDSFALKCSDGHHHELQPTTIRNKFSYCLAFFKSKFKSGYSLPMSFSFLVHLFVQLGGCLEFTIHLPIFLPHAREMPSSSGHPQANQYHAANWKRASSSASSTERNTTVVVVYTRLSNNNEHWWILRQSPNRTHRSCAQLVACYTSYR